MTHTITTRDLLFEVIMQIKCRMRKDIGVIGVDLNPMQMKTLLCLQASGETPQTRLCRSMRRNKGQVARLTADLEQRKYLEKTTDENDKRRTLLRLTSKGGNAVRRFREAEEAMLRRLLRDFSMEEIEALNAMLERMNANMQKDRA